MTRLTRPSEGSSALLIAAALLAAGLPSMARGDDDTGEDSEGPEPLVEELFAVELAFPQEAGEVQIGLAVVGLTGPAGESLESAIEVEFGLTDWLQIAAGLPLHAAWPPAPADAAYGLGDVEVGALAALVLHPRLIAAVAFELTLPVGDAERGFGEGEVGYSPSLRAALDAVGAQWHAFTGLEAGDELGVEYGLGVTVPIGESWAVTLEGVGQATDDGHRISAVPGVVWRGMSALQVGLAAHFLAGDDAADGGLSALVITEF